MDLEEKLDRWWFPRTPSTFNNEEKKLIIGCIVQQLIKQVFGSHFYMFDNRIYQQKYGCPMGLSGSCPVSRIVMDHLLREIRKIEDKQK